MPLARFVVIASFVLGAACSSNDVTGGAVDAGESDASVADASDAGAHDAETVEASANDSAAKCAPRAVLGADTAQITVLGEASLWSVASADETLVGYASDETTVVLADELPGNPARWAIVAVPLDRSTPRRIAIETSAPTELRIFGHDAYWLTSDTAGSTLRTIAIDAAATSTPRTVTTLPPAAVQGAYFVDGDAVHWLERRTRAGADAGDEDDAVLVHTALAGDGTPEDGPTLAPYAPASAPAPPSTTPRYFQTLAVRNGYVYFALVTASSDPQAARSFAVERELATGGTVDMIAQSAGESRQIVTTGDFVYWVIDRGVRGADGSAVTVDYAIAQAAFHDGSGHVIAMHDPINPIDDVPFVRAVGTVLYWFDGPNKTAEFLRAYCE